MRVVVKEEFYCTQIDVQLKCVWLINTFPKWCIVNHEMDPLAYVNLYLDEDALCPGELCPVLEARGSIPGPGTMCYY